LIQQIDPVELKAGVKRQRAGATSRDQPPGRPVIKINEQGMTNKSTNTNERSA
jgi:hypothetical protein